jgi:ferredoxin/NAD(P)H-dependent FMN reductase
MINAVNLAYFSPTHTTKRILQDIAGGLGIPTGAELDLTPPHAAAREVLATEGDLFILGAPVYAGRIPPVALSRLGCLKGKNTPAVVIAVYGNREYEDALLELKDFAEASGFQPIAGAAFIGEHSYATKQAPIAWNRPDAADLNLAAAFGRMIQHQIHMIEEPLSYSPLQVPGRRPYVERKQPVPRVAAAPVTDDTLCTRCGTCAKACPVAAIVVDDAVINNEEACIRCSACIKQCPQSARSWRAESVLQTIERLRANYLKRREPELFLLVK